MNWSNMLREAQKRLWLKCVALEVPIKMTQKRIIKRKYILLYILFACDVAFLFPAQIFCPFINALQIILKWLQSLALE